MARKTREEALATRERLLDAAQRLFREHGVTRTSLAEVATAAGMTRGAVYWHFKDKADLFRAMCDRATLPLDASFDQVVQSASTDPLGTLRTLSIGALLQDHLARQAESGGRGGGLPHVVGLHRALGDQGVGLIGECVAQQIFELPGLVAAAGEAGAVVALDPQVRAASRRRRQRVGQCGEGLQRRGEMGEADRIEAGEMHLTALLHICDQCEITVASSLARRRPRPD